MTHEMKRIQSKSYQIRTYSINKISLSCLMIRDIYLIIELKVQHTDIKMQRLGLINIEKQFVSAKAIHTPFLCNIVAHESIGMIFINFSMSLDSHVIVMQLLQRKPAYNYRNYLLKDLYILILLHNYILTCFCDISESDYTYG